MKCNRCGAELNVIQQPNGQNLGICPVCANQMIIRDKQSALGIVAFILSLLCVLSPIGLILGIIDLATNKSKKKGLSIAAVVIGAVFSIVLVFGLFSNTDDNNKEVNQTEQSASSESTDKPQKESESNDDKEDIQSFIDSCVELNYKDVARNPENYIGKNFYTTVEVFDVRTGGAFSGYDYYYITYTLDEYGWSDKCIWLIDKRKTNSEGYVKVLEDDKIKVYGTFEGMIDTKNSLSGTKGEEVGLYIKFVELIEE